MNKHLRNFLMLFLAVALIMVVSGCSEKEKASDEGQTETTESNETKNEKAKNPDQEIQDFVLENTKIVKIFSISQRIDQQQPDLGPFDVVRGMDQRGQKSELWIKDMKIYQMINSNSNQASATNPVSEENQDSVKK